MTRQRTHIRIAGLDIWGSREPGSAWRGVYLGPEGISGWDDGVDVRRDRVEREAGHGDFDVPGRLAGRMVTFTGQVRTPSADETRQLGARLKGLLADGGRSRVTVRRDEMQYADCRLGGRTLFAPVFGRREWADWQLQLWMPDPRKFGELHRSAATPSGTDVAVHHWGNFAAAPLLEVYTAGGMPGGYAIHGPDGRRFTVAIASGNTASFRHFIDMASGQLLDANRQPIYGATTRADTWAVPPGQKVTHRLVPVAGSGTLTVEVRDTYI